MHTFETPGPTTIVVRTGAGHVTVAAGDTDTTTVELTALNSAGEEAIAQATVEQSRQTVVVHRLRRHRRRDGHRCREAPDRLRRRHGG